MKVNLYPPAPFHSGEGYSIEPNINGEIDVPDDVVQHYEEHVYQRAWWDSCWELLYITSCEEE